MCTRCAPVQPYEFISRTPKTIFLPNGAAGIQHLVENNSRHRWICALARVVTAGGGWGLCHIICVCEGSCER